LQKEDTLCVGFHLRVGYVTSYAGLLGSVAERFCCE